MKLISFRTYYVLCFFIIFLYLWQWRSMPLYPDEVAYAILNTRFVVDHGILYSLYSICESNAKLIPSLFHAAAYSLSGLGSISHWQLNRIVPTTSLMLLVAATLAFVYQRSQVASVSRLFILSAGFIGVAGSGLVLLRPETYLILCGAILIGCYLYCNSSYISNKKSIFLWLVICYVGSITIYVHAQSLVLIPAILIMLCRLAYTIRKPYSLMFALLSLVSAASFCYYSYLLNLTFTCANSPSIAEMVSHMTLPSMLSHDRQHLILKLIEHFHHYDRISFSPPFQISYLPAVAFETLKFPLLLLILNKVINFLSYAILFTFLGLCMYLTGVMVNQVILVAYARKANIRSIATFFQSDFFLYYCVCLAHLALFFYDTQLNFYRVFYLNLAMTVLLQIGLTTIKNNFILILSGAIGLLAVGVCISSIYITNITISPLLEGGYTGPSTPLSTNWESIDDSINELKRKCGIADSTKHVLVEDITYDALKRHTPIYPVTYLMLSSHTSHLSYISLIKQFNINAAVIRCGFFELFKIQYEARIGDLCCANFQRKRELGRRS